MRSAAWIAATTVGFVVVGTALHSPGAVSLGQYAFEWDVPSAILGVVLGSIVGAITGFLQTRTISGPPARFIIAAAVAVAVAHALADGAPATWGVSFAAAISAVAATLAFAWAMRSFNPFALAVMVLAWWLGWVGGVAVLGVVAPIVGYGTVDHLVIGAALGLAWGTATSPAMCRMFRERRVISRSLSVREGGA